MKNVKFVSIDGRHLGHSYDQPGDDFLLGNVITPHPMMGGDAFGELFLRTRSGNIYHIVRETDTFGRRGNFVLENARTKLVVPLDTDSLSNAAIRIGESFSFGSGQTSPLTEIVPVNSPRCYDFQHLTDLTNGAKCPIKDDFNAMFKSS